MTIEEFGSTCTELVSAHGTGHAAAWLMLQCTLHDMRACQFLGSPLRNMTHALVLLLDTLAG